MAPRTPSYTDHVATRNVTITLDEDTARWVRVEAAKQDMSISKLVARMLRSKMAEDQGYEASMGSFLSRGPRVLKHRGGYPTRDDLHDRADLR